MRPDLVLCLAVVHHLALTNNVPLDEIVAFLADFGAPLVVEFPHRDDVMATPPARPQAHRPVRRLRRDQLGAGAASNASPSTSRQVLPSGTRTLYRCRPR